MDTARRLLLFNLAVGFYNVGTVWLTQVTCYPLFAQVGPAEFTAYHLAWWHGIWGVILGPAIVGFLGAVAMLRWRPPHISIRSVWLAVGVLVAVYSLTAVWWGPLMARLIHAVDPTGAATHESPPAFDDSLAPRGAHHRVRGPDLPVRHCELRNR